MTDTSISLSLKLWPNQVLRTKCESDLPGEDFQTKRIGQEMIRIMQMHNGFGLSAPQVGLNYRIFVMRNPKDTRPLVFINPRIQAHSEEQTTLNEGCLSLLSLQVPIPRYDWVVASGFHLEPTRYEGIYARCIQHEIDHLNGILIFDHIKSSIGRKLFLDKYIKAKKVHDRM